MKNDKDRIDVGNRKVKFMFGYWIKFKFGVAWLRIGMKYVKIQKVLLNIQY